MKKNHEGSKTFIKQLTESDTRIPGFDKKLAAFVKRTAKITDSDDGWTVTLTQDLDGNKLKPRKIMGITKPEAIREAGNALLKILHATTPDGVPAMCPVESSNIRKIGFDEDKKELYVQFHAGSTYVYFNVPKAKAIGLMEAASHGAYLASEIKDRYECEKLEG